ncbi:PAS domain-containing protein [Pannonibacter tanglangensis]|uniref:PAS domain-containing protein n=1 Tax=Pannonibacter tanglangensis TaxID=2750084 RepID=A0ABW9ZF08_9HYPH|nr:PAS domain-containing protein [Pannonibacter sp. XCT-34]NBN63428.1 PAS domain-containing protein [Pannonibacter sp. XCT-34]
MQQNALAKVTPADEDGMAADATVEASAVGQPVLRLAGLLYLIADLTTRRLIWQETGSQTFEGQPARAQEAPLADALRMMPPQTQKNLLAFLQTVLKRGKAGPADVGGDAESGLAGVSLYGLRYDAEDGRSFVICHPVGSLADTEGGAVVRGLAPILRHFVENSTKIVLTVDNYGYIRYASPAFLQVFGITDPPLCLGRNIAHIPKRVGKTLALLTLTALSRRAGAAGRGRFQLPGGDSILLNYSVVFFRVSDTVGGVLFSAEPSESGRADFAKVFDIMTAPVLVVCTKTRKILAANKAARKVYKLTQQVMDDTPITETLLHPKSFTVLLEAARKGTVAPQSVVVNSMDGVSKNKRLRALLIEAEDQPPRLVLEGKA